MSQDKTMSIMLFVLGLFLIAVGIGVSTITQRETRYQNVYGFQVPYQATTQPYVGVGAVMVLFGIIVLVVAFIKARTKRERTVSMTVEMPKNAN